MFGAAAVLADVIVAAKNFPTIHRRCFPVPFGIATRQTNVLRNL
jgi:hypothetical protein